MNNSSAIKDAIIKKIEMKKQQRKCRMAIFEKAIGNMASEVWNKYIHKYIHWIEIHNKVYGAL